MAPPASFPAGLREALGAPALAMGVTFLAFGAAAAEAGLGLGWTLAASLLVYGMAGQMVLLQLVGVPGAGIAGAVLGATAANARFFPMAVAIAPWLGPDRRRRWWTLPFIAITPWAAGMRRLPTLAPAARLPWFLGFALASWLAAAAAAASGYGLASLLDPALRAVLLFANPLYFALLLAAELRVAPSRRAIVLGALAAPAALLLPPAWGLLSAGVLGGSLAYLLGRRRRR